MKDRHKVFQLFEISIHDLIQACEVFRVSDTTSAGYDYISFSKIDHFN